MDWSFGSALHMTRTGSDGSLGLHTPAHGSPLAPNASHKVSSLDSIMRTVQMPGDLAGLAVAGSCWQAVLGLKLEQQVSSQQ